MLFPTQLSCITKSHMIQPLMVERLKMLSLKSTMVIAELNLIRNDYSLQPPQVQRIILYGYLIKLQFHNCNFFQDGSLHLPAPLKLNLFLACLLIFLHTVFLMIAPHHFLIEETCQTKWNFKFSAYCCVKYQPGTHF